MRLRNVGAFLSTHTPPTHGPSTNMQQCNAEWDNKNAFLFLAFRFGQTRNLMSCSIQSTYLPACRCGCGGHANQHAMQYAQLTIFILCLHALASPIYIYIYISIGVWPFVAHIDRNMADIWALPRSVCRCPSPLATRHTRSFAHCIFVFFVHDSLVAAATRVSHVLWCRCVRTPHSRIQVILFIEVILVGNHNRTTEHAIIPHAIYRIGSRPRSTVARLGDNVCLLTRHIAGRLFVHQARAFAPKWK